jgi:iron complex transport system substrate-binding protein
MADTLGSALEALQIPVVYVDLETPEQYFRDVAILGQLLGNEARAQEIQAFYQSRLDQVAAGTEAVSDAEKPRVLLLQYSNQGGEVAFNVPSASWLQTIEAELAGGAPIWKEAAKAGGWTVVGFEQIAAWDPDRIFVIAYGADAAQVVEELKGDARWQSLRAVRDGQIYGFPGDYYSWDQPDPRWILGMVWLASKIHPDRMADLDMMSEISSFFGQMYGMDEATIQEHVLPVLKGNVQ